MVTTSVMFLMHCLLFSLPVSYLDTFAHFEQIWHRSVFSVNNINQLNFVYLHMLSAPKCWVVFGVQTLPEHVLAS